VVKKALLRFKGQAPEEDLFFGGSDIQEAPNEWFKESNEGQLAVDVYETATEIVIKAPVAGVSEEDISISIKRDNVTINGERKEEREVATESYTAQECFWGSFSRVISLPVEGEAEKASATLKKGILEIRVPKSKKEHEVVLKINS